jgi:NAD dependent epimerase/dehydratase family enzyme
MLPIRWNVGGPISDGKFFMSWVHLQDLNNLIFWVLDKKIGGIFNGVAPNPITNLEFVRTIAARLNKLAIFPVPYCVFRLITGEIAQAICASQRIYPKAIIDSGFQFDFPTLELALKDLLP